jgi:hypothetical protein
MKSPAFVALLFYVSAFAAPPQYCTPFTVVTQDALKNVKQGLDQKNAEWADKLRNRYPCWLQWA